MIFSKSEYIERLNKVKKSMQEKGIDLLISQDTANINYLTGYDAWSFYYAQCVIIHIDSEDCLLYTSPSPRDGLLSRMPSSA